MAENTVKKIATRESYGNSLKELAEEFPNLVVLDADLAAATKTGIFRKAYPDRHIDCVLVSNYTTDFNKENVIFLPKKRHKKD